jgi:hypothetical protein
MLYMFEFHIARFLWHYHDTVDATTTATQVVGLFQDTQHNMRAEINKKTDYKQQKKC